MAKRNNDDTFVKITNKDVYDRIERGFENLNKKMDDLCKNNDDAHDQIIIRQDRTNGKVKLNKWIATTAMAIITTLIFLLLSGTIK